jgi:hypothetical protein
VVPPCSDRIARVPPYSRTNACITRTGLSPAEARLSRRFRLSRIRHWPGPRSLATTSGVSVDVLSSRYLDVSVPWVRLKPPMNSGASYLHLDDRGQTTDNRQAEIRSSVFSHLATVIRRWVSPFGNPWIKASSQLPTAYRSVARPSSPLSAKASTEHP